MPGYNPGLPDIDETDQTQQKNWWYYFVYGVCFWIALASILIYAIALSTIDGSFAFAWLALFFTAVPLVVLPRYLYRMYAIIRHWQKSDVEKDVSTKRNSTDAMN